MKNKKTEGFKGLHRGSKHRNCEDQNKKLLLDSINLRLNGGDNNLTKSGKKSCTPLLVEQICDIN